MIEGIDLFCGAGGLTAGLQKAGIVVRAGYDIDASCAYAFEHNNKSKFFARDVAVVSKEEAESHYSRKAVRLLAGCAPCQPFSTYTQGRDTKSDKKWPLLNHFARLIRETEPELVTMENVPDVVKHKVYHDFVKTLEDSGYHVWAERVYCVDYGVPQSRQRHVLLASRLGAIELLPPTHKGKPRTVRETIGSLPALNAGEADEKDILHRAAKLTDVNLKRIRASRPGGSWRDWPSDLRAACHSRGSGKTFPSVYGRMSWDEPGPTMTTLCFGFGNGRFGHPEQDRAISLREAALLQSFPKSYKFVNPKEPVRFKSVGRMIGNAVPVRLGEIIGRSLQAHLERCGHNN